MEQAEEEEDKDSTVQKEAMRRRISLGVGGSILPSASDSLLAKQLSQSKGNSPTMRSREASGTPPTPGTGGVPLRMRSNVDSRSPGGFGIRDRAHTVSGEPSPRKISLSSQTSGIRRGPDFLRSGSSASTSNDRGHERVTGISPQFVFLQLYHNYNSKAGGPKPILLPATKMIETSIRNLDRIHA